ncbi:MAG: hypothetical protein H6Q00_900 [Holophagaceae bacterium]|nr:hypothetical protein [Holophagaceae bacterium]
MRFTECEAMLQSDPLHLETGIERLSSGGIHVAIRMCLENCTAEMLEWWFGCECDTDMYRLWHPGAHKFSKWGEYEANHVPGNVIGSTHFIKETLGNSDVMDMQLKYLDPMDLFGAKLTEARKRGDADVVLYGWAGIGENWECERNEQGYPNFMQYVGVGRNTPFGLVLRNHYWFADMLDVPSAEVEKMVQDQLGLYMLEHDSNEFHILGKVIPSFYLRDNWEKLGEPEPYTKHKELSKLATTKLFV